MSKIKETTLTRFIKDNCANYDRHYQSCLFADSCKVLDGQRCGYFEKCVLGLPDYKGRLPDYDYAKLFAQYAELTDAPSQAVEQRRCKCGNPLSQRQRFCDVYYQKKRKDAYRKINRKRAG